MAKVKIKFEKRKYISKKNAPYLTAKSAKIINYFNIVRIYYRKCTSYLPNAQAQIAKKH